MVFQQRLKLVRIDLSMDYVLARRTTRISAAKIHNKLIKSHSPHKATHFRGHLFQLPCIFCFFDFHFGGSLTDLVLFRTPPSSRTVSLAEGVSAMQFLYLIVPFWYASAAYQVSLVEPWFVFWRDAVEPKYPWRDQTSLIRRRSVPKRYD